MAIVLVPCRTGDMFAPFENLKLEGSHVEGTVLVTVHWIEYVSDLLGVVKASLIQNTLSDSALLDIITEVVSRVILTYVSIHCFHNPGARSSLTKSIPLIY